MQPKVHKPSEILVTEEYSYKSKVSGVRSLKLDSAPTGLITVTVPYDSRKLSLGASLGQQRNAITPSAIGEWLAKPVGYLRCNHYGVSNLDREPDLAWEGDLLPLKINLSSNELSQLFIHRQRQFDLQLSQTYQPDEPPSAPLEVTVFIVDEDSQADESDRKELIKELRKQADIKRSLIIKFRVKLSLPTQKELFYEGNTLPIKMVLQWPLATPHRLAKLSIGITSYPLIYNPENGTIECNHIPLKLQSENQGLLTVYCTDKISLEISEPIELYEKIKLRGSVSVALNGLMSGLALDHLDPDSKEVGDVSIKRCTILKNEFVMNLEEGLENKNYLPRQHLHFPGVVLNEMRVADVMMLLEDKGFEIKKHKESDDHESGTKTYVIEAKRSEGARELGIFILVQGTNAQTTRERGVMGQAKFTTPLSVGDTSIYIQGRLPGDSKRIVNMINEIQKRLKEQFRHVGTAE